ncbi:hypothetical protein FFF34_010810 [Inquilinus sp. KBS0705]|nr:hypothetical protein FFF34_010810 [Inquilinus sp. KBS0705]
MLSKDFQRLIIICYVVIFVLIIAFALYCRRRARSYVGTGRVTDIEAWQVKATISWIAAFCLSVTFLFMFLEL